MNTFPRNLKDRFLGCLLGCAVGDALGAPFEGYWPHSIPCEAELLTGFAEFEGFPLGQYTDDTQLSAATVEAIVEARDIMPAEIAESIAELWKTQSVVGPGGACTRAAHEFLKDHDWTACGAPIGQAGNGTAMRLHVIGLHFLQDSDRLPAIAADISSITHKDPRSIAGGVAVAKATNLLLMDEPHSPGTFCGQIASAMEPFDQSFADQVRALPRLLDESPEIAVKSIAWSGMNQPEFDEPIITPFVIPTVLAALWCVLRYPDSWPAAVASAIRLGGDVDTLGAIVGALMGTKLGMSAIPPHLVETVLNSKRLQTLAVRYFVLATGRK